LAKITDCVHPDRFSLPTHRQFFAYLAMSSQESQESSKEKHLELAHKFSSRGIWSHLRAEVDPDHSTPPLAAFSFMTGFMCDNNLASSSSRPYLHSKVMQSHSQQFLCGVDSKPATSFR
jgi:hypothetical protein